MAVPLTLKLIAKTAGFQKNLLEAEKSFNKTTKKFLGDSQAFRKIGTEFKTIGTKITLGIGVPIAAAVFAVTKAAGDFELAFIGVKKTVEGTETEFATLRQGIIDMADKLPFSAVQIANVAEKAGQLGLKITDVQDFTKVMLDMGVSTDLSAEDAAIALARLLKITGDNTDNARNFGSAIVALGNNIEGSEREIVEMALNFGAIASKVGLSSAEVVGFAAAVVATGAKAEAGGTAISEVFRRVAIAVAEGGAELNSIAEIAGTTAAAFKKDLETDAAGAIAKLFEGISKVPGAAGDTFVAMDEINFTGKRLGGTVIALAADFVKFNKTVDLSTEAYKKNTALGKESEKFYGAFNNILKTLISKFNTIFIKVGSELIPIFKKFSEEVIEPLIKKFGELAEEFTKLDSDDQQFFLELAAAVVVGGPLLIGLGFLISSLQKVGFGLFLFKQLLLSKFVLDFALGIKGLAVAMFSLQGAVAPIVLSVLAATAAIGGVLAATLALTGELDFWKDQATKAFDTVKGKVSELSDEMFGAGGQILDVQKAFDEMSKKAGEATDFVIDGIKDVIGFAKKKKKAIIILSREELAELTKTEDARTAMLAASEKAEFDLSIKQNKAIKKQIFDILRKFLEDKAKLRIEDQDAERLKETELVAKVQEAAQEKFDLQEGFRNLKETAARVSADAINGIINGEVTSSSQVWKTFGASVVSIFAVLVANAFGAGIAISTSMALATAGITLVVGLLASVFGGRKKKDTQVKDAVDNFLKEVKRSLEDFEGQILTTLQMVTRNANRARELAKVIPERLQVLSRLQNLSPETVNGSLFFRALFDETTDFFKQVQRLGSNVANTRERFRDIIKEQILLLTKNSQETLDLINAEFDLKKANIKEILNLLERQKDFIKDINASITDVGRAFFTKEQLFTAQKGDVATLKDALLTATGENKLNLLADLKSALLTSFQTAKDIFAPKNQAEIDALRADQKTLQAKTNQTAADIALQQTIANKIEALTIQDLQSEEMLVGFQQSIIADLKNVRASGITAFDKLIDLQLKELAISENSLVTEEGMRALLFGITKASFLSAKLLGEIAKNPTAATPTNISNLSKALGFIFTDPTNPVTLAASLATAESLPMLAQGGIVNRPTNAIIGEAGPEAIIPLGSGLLGSTTINVTLNVKDAASLSTTKWEQILKENLGTAMERINRQGFRSSLQPKAVI